ncbi:HugZ family pyridoxamine 5'-phosphate oxidase [Thiolapillus sp.]
MNTADPVLLTKEARMFRARFQTVVLSTATHEGVPDTGTAPFILDSQERICVLLSELATHTRNLMENPQACLAFLESEEECRNLFARKRLILHCSAKRLQSTERETTLDSMEERLGNTVGLLRSLGDFHLFAFQVDAGSYIRGFGQAWEIQDSRLQIGRLRSQ